MDDLSAALDAVLQGLPGADQRLMEGVAACSGTTESAVALLNALSQIAYGAAAGHSPGKRQLAAVHARRAMMHDIPKNPALREAARGGCFSQLRDHLAAAAGIGAPDGQGFPPVGSPDRAAYLGCSDLLCAVGVLEFPTQDGWWDSSLRHAVGVVRALQPGAVSRSAEARLLWALAPDQLSHEINSGLTQYYWQSLMPQLLAPVPPLSVTLSIARHATESMGGYRVELFAPLVNALLQAMRDQPHLRAEGGGAAASDALQISRILLDAGFRKQQQAVQLAGASMHVACQLVADLVPQIRRGAGAHQVAQAAGAVFAAEAVTASRSCAAALECFSEALNVTGAGHEVIKCIPMLPHFVSAAVEPRDTPPSVSELLPEHTTFSDPGSTPREAAAWALRLLSREDGEGGPSPPVTPGRPMEAERARVRAMCIEGAVAAIASGIKMEDPGLTEAALWLLEAFAAEDSAGEILDETCIAVAAAGQLALTGMELGFYAGAVISRFARHLPKEIHAQLVSVQWRAVCDESQQPLRRALATAGLSRAVQESVVRPGLLEGTVLLQPSVEPLLALAASCPAVVAECLNTLLQVVPAAVLRHTGAAAKVVNTIGCILRANRNDIRICTSALRALHQGLCGEDIPGEIVSEAAPGVYELLRGVLQDPSMHVMQAPAFEALFSFVSRAPKDASCAAIVQAVLGSAASADCFHEKITLRLAAKTVSIGAHVCPADTCGPLQMFAARVLEGCLDYDSVTAAAAGSAAVLILGALPEAAGLLATASAAAAGVASNKMKGWAWAPVIIPWAVAASADPRATIQQPQVTDLLALWLSVDAVFEPALRQVSAAAALKFLLALDEEALSTSLPLVPIHSYYERRPDTAGPPVHVPLRMALFAVLLRFADRSPSRPIETFAGTPFVAAHCRLPLVDQSGALQQGISAALTGLPPESQQGLRQLITVLGSKQPS
eukprot:Hpha_TRINITY_DN2860_c0_g1::TRINITY_DN2860_c0_g1_i1::g.171365::m.171365